MTVTDEPSQCRRISGNRMMEAVKEYVVITATVHTHIR